MSKAISKKEDAVKEVINELKNAKIIGIVNLEKLPSNYLKNIKKDLSESTKLIFKPKNVLRRALKAKGKGFDELIPHLKGVCGLVTLNNSSFKLAITLGKNRLPVYAEKGAVATQDVILEEGPTPLMPGETMTELTNLGVKVSPKGGKVNITETSTLIKKGEKFTKLMTKVLNALKIKPLTVGLELIAAYEDGRIFTSNELTFNANELINKLTLGYSNAFNLSYNAGIINKSTIELLLSKAFNEAMNLAREAGIINKETVGDVMLSAKTKGMALASIIKWEVN